MADPELPQPNGDHFEDGNLSAFENAFSNLPFDSLPPDPSQHVSEIDTIHNVMQELSEQYGFDYVIYDGRELGYKLALNHRLDDLDYTSPHPITDEIAIAIQQNSLSEEQAEELCAHLTDEEGLELKEEKDLERLHFNLYQVLEAVVVDPLGEFVNDIQAQGRVTTSLQRSADFIQYWIDDKPRRDAEELPAKEYIESYIRRWLEKTSILWTKHKPEFVPQFKEVTERLFTELSETDTSILQQRGYLNHILRMFNNIFSMAFGGSDGFDLELKFNQTQYDDVVSLITEL